MNTVISFLALSYLMYLLYNLIIYYKDININNNKNKVKYLPIPTVIINEFDFKYN
jgi:hypothetical protein